MLSDLRYRSSSLGRKFANAKYFLAVITLVFGFLASKANATTYFDFRASTGTAISNNGDGTICSTSGMSCKYVVINLGQPTAAIIGPKYYQFNTTNFNILGGGCPSGALDIAVYDDAEYTKFDFQFPLAGSGTTPLPGSTNVNFNVPADKFAQLIFGCNENGFQSSTIDGGPGSYQIRNVNALLYSGLPNLCIGDTPADCGATSVPTLPSEPSLVQITDFPGETAKHPNWSPKSDFISYISNRASGNGRMNDVWAVAPDGSNAHQLTVMPDDGFEGGTFEAFWIGSTGDLVVVDVNFTFEWLRLHLFPDLALPAVRTAFDGPSPNFQELLVIPGGLGGLSFAVSRDGGSAAWSTMITPSGSCPWVTNAVVAPFGVLNGQATTSVGSLVASGSFGCNQIPKSEAISGISFSPDASQFVLARASDPNVLGYDLEIYTTGGGFVRKLTNNGSDPTPVINWNPSWSSDNRIAFASNSSGRFEIYTINPDGSNLQPITTNGGDWPTWSPDSSKIAFQSTRSGNSEIYSLSAVAQNQLTVPPSSLGPPNLTLNPQATVAEPVSTGNGNYFYQHTDFVIPGRGLPLAFTRTYNARDSYVGPLGANWTHSYNIVLKKGGDGGITIRWGDGHSEIFTPSAGAYVTQPGVVSKLTSNSDGTFVLTKKDLSQYSFSNSGQLVSIKDRNGNAVALTYDAASNLTAVTDPGGRTLTLIYDSANRITHVIDPIGRTVSFSYNASNDLISATDQASGVMAFAYDASHRVLSITQPTGILLFTNTYDSMGRVISQTNGRGLVTGFAYDTPTLGNTTITDARGNKTVHTYDSLLRIIKITDPAGGITNFSYDSNNNRISATNQNGNITNFAYDAQGNITGITDPFPNTVSFTYDSLNNLLIATNPKGKTTTFAYDSHSNLTSIQDVLGNTTTFAYNGFGQIISKTDARGNMTSFSYDLSGNLTKITNVLGNVTTLSYDGIGRLSALTDPNGHTATASYDFLSRLVKVSDSLGNQTQFAYDPNGNLVKITDAKGNATSYAYDAANNLTAVTDALQHITQYSYDPNNNRVKFTNAKGNATSYTFDALNRLSSVTDPLGFVTAYQYDLIGNVTQTTDAKGQTNKFSYDALNRLISIAYADGKTVAYAFDANGNRTSMVDTHGMTTYAYDALDRLISVAHPGGKIVGYAYDAVGNRIKLTYPDGKVTGYSYDPTNRLSQVTDWLGRSTGYSYDPVGNLIRTAYPNGASIGFTYDAANRLSRIVNAAALGAPMVTLGYTLDPVGNRTGLNINGLPITFGYDALNELTSAQLGLLKTTWTYDAAGNRLKEIGPAGTINYTYDAADHLLQAGTRLFAYDANGNETSATMSLTGTPVIYQYDAANRLIAASGFKPSVFAYDGDGNRVAQSVGSGTYSYINDVATALPVVLQESGPDGPITYEYGLGLIEAFSPEFNFFYHYDGVGSIIALTNAAGRSAAAYAYDPWGNALLDISDSIGTKNKFRYTGEALDPGTQLYYLRMRYYDTSTGRLNSVDPLMLLLNTDSTVLRYGYAANNPITQIDPTGALSLRDVGFQIQAFSTSVVEGLATDITILGSKVASAAVIAAAQGTSVVTAVAKTAAKSASNASQFFKLSVLGSVVGFAITASNEVLISSFGREKLVHIPALDLGTGAAGSIIGSFIGPEGTLLGAVIGGAIGADLGSLLIPKTAK